VALRNIHQKRRQPQIVFAGVVLLAIAAAAFVYSGNNKQEEFIADVFAPDASFDDAPNNINEMLFRGVSDEYIFLYGKDIAGGVERTIEVDMTPDGHKARLAIRRETPNGTRIMAIANNIGQNFVLDIVGESEQHAFDEWWEMREGYYAQITAVDLDGNGIKEIVVSVGNASYDMITYIYKFTNSFDEPFVLVGSIYGQQYMELKHGSIFVPIGSQGYFDSYKYDKGILYKYDSDGKLKEVG